MYSTCLFCNHALGRNDSIEQFPVGRRLAFDAARGRLWVVCKSCARWNLSPLETRWEAIEEAERAYRDSRLRVATDHIGMAKLRDGLELVRIGNPLRPELATWRYGDIFRKRQRRANLWRSGAAILSTASLLAIVTNVGAMIGGVGVLVPFLHFGPQLMTSAEKRRARVHLAVNEGKVVRLDFEELGSNEIRINESATEWWLRVRHKRHVTRGEPIRSRDGGFLNGEVVDWSDLHGDDARAALTRITPIANRDGASARTVFDAVNRLEESPDPNTLLLQYPNFRVLANGTRSMALGHMPHSMRLAIEMSLHEADERRAMEGEMQALTDRWREAEEVAAISDSLLTPAALLEKLKGFRASSP